MAYYRILLADDEEQFRSTIVNCFPWNQFGFEISSQASNGEEALKYLKRFQYDMVLSDIQMPIMSGIELAKYSMKMENAPYFIFLSGYQEFEYAKKAIEYGVKNYIVKPIRFDELSEILIKVRKELDEKKGNQNCTEKSFEEIVNEYIELHLQDATLSGCAEKLHMNPSYVSWLYKQKTDRNFSDYLIDKRMQMAKELLMEGKLCVYEIAERVGYSNSNNFTQMFHSYYGMTPKAYQRICEKD